MQDVVAIYARISNEKEDTDVSIAQQIEQGKEFAKSKGMGYLIYKDEGLSGTLEANERPEMWQLLQDIVKKDSKIKILWGREHFRLYRGTESKRQIQIVCKKHDVDIYYGDKKLDRSDPNVELMDDILGVLGKFYVNLTKQNVKQAIKKNFNDGKAHGVAPYGYKTGEGKKLEIDDDQAKWVRKMFQWHIEGLGLTSITQKLTNFDVPTQYSPDHIRFSKEWDRTTVYGILKNKLYYGIRTHNDWKIEKEGGKKKRVLVSSREISVPHLAIIEEHTYNESILAFDKLKSYTGKRTKHKYLLIDLLECEHCNGRYLGRADNRNNDVYKCNNKRKWSGKDKIKDKTCNNRDIRKGNIEFFVWDYLSDGKTLLDNLLANGDKENEERKAKLEEEIAAFEKAIDKLNAELNTSRLSHRKGLYTDKEFEADKIEINRTKIEYSIKLKNHKEQLRNIIKETNLLDGLQKEFALIADSTTFADDDSPLLQTIKKQKHEKEVLNSRYGFNDKQEFLNKYVDRILINYANEIFKLTFKFKSPLTESVVYMDRNFYVAIDANTKAVYDLKHPKSHNLLANLNKLTKTILSIQAEKKSD
ncbi:recombinase family protein [Flagellimonas myxillae]|uniref:recombinase family protein n=1 Tax=Flagellimonas myxillae TaxID=2942214 RepID=UPI00201EC0C5|nr:recombinase family protein [Muricauda myxillae]MCL6264913.1 recombinase family protein [Muricauda myxillae]